jgi:stage V sporulation protein R
MNKKNFQKFMSGSPVLMGDKTIPGVTIPENLKNLLPKIYQAVHEFGCDFYPTVVEMLTYDEISEIAAYGGFPVRYPHWKWGMEYEDLQKGYMHGMHKIYEMVINTNPVYLYCLDSNTLVDNVTVVAHALGHADFFKNNIYFSHTSQNMMNQLANHGITIRKYMTRWGKERVTEFIDHVLRIETLIDTSKAWQRKKVVNPIVKDERKYRHPSRLKVETEHDYMEKYINTDEWIHKQKENIEKLEVADYLDIYHGVTKDIMGFIRDNAPLKPWEADIVAMLYNESMYFAPQRITKTINEGWASFIDYNIMARQGFSALGQESDGSGIIEYSSHKMGVLGGKYSMNPYKLGFNLFCDIEERWNKGQFGLEWEECNNIKEKENWDKKLNLGHEKVFEVRKFYNDLMLITEFFTAEFCEKYEFFEWKKYPNGEYKIESRDHNKIKKKLIQRYTNGGLPEITLVDPNHMGRGIMLLEHKSDGRPLYDAYVRPVLQSLRYLWKNDVYLTTKDLEGKEYIYRCLGDGGNIDLTTAEDYLSEQDEEIY